MSEIKKISDSFSLREDAHRAPSMEDFLEKKKGFRTRVTISDEFGNVLMDYESNKVVIGGAITTLEKLFNVRSPLVIDTINNICDIEPAEQNPDTLPYEHKICLWAVGIGGCGDAFGSVRDVKYYEREVGRNGTGITEMIPFRVVTSPFEDENAEKYFLMKELSAGHYGYYAKVFDDDPFIRSLWKDGVEGEDGTEVTDGVHDTTRTDEIETFVEMHMTLDKNDVREWFDLNGEIERARVNTIGLFSATEIKENGVVTGYKDIKLFSKFCMDNESLSSRKSLLVRYRIYAS